MQRYFVNTHANDQGTFKVEHEDAHHMLKVMRMKPGDCFFSVFLNGQSALAKIVEITSESVIASVIEWKDEDKELPVGVTIVSGLPKGDKLEYVIQKGTELGAARFIPFKADRSIVKWDAKKASKKRDRWEKIAKEAAEQSHRTIVPTIDEPQTLQELVAISQNYDHKLIAYEEAAKEGEYSVLATKLANVSPGDSLLFVFGPEGGLSTDEVVHLKENGFQACGLGPRILRTETAPLYALSAISFKFELMR
ncbi:16S rRNA (uracil(1498)-N(3))-methyltransferase [Bacillus spongiae]|uniref:Ribosomal RNA small subunit methyltransferase E n=1 Tax=Bacillus spongiae TaxID=2683610 RepID=A0ABU8H9D2_9BACI